MFIGVAPEAAALLMFLFESTPLGLPVSKEVTASTHRTLVT